MSEEFLRALSVASNYFVLVDGLALDLEDYLADDVLLDFFGQTVKGGKNVAAFIKCQKISRHVFEEILPKMSIGYRESRPLRRKYHSAGSVFDNNPESTDFCELKYKRKCYSDAFYQNQKHMDDSFLDDPEFEMDFNTTAELSSTKIEPEVSESFIEKQLNIDRLQLDTFSTPQITVMQDKYDSGASMTSPDVEMSVFPEPTQVEDVEMHISQLKARGMVMNDGDAQGFSLKFLEACGAVEFCKVFSTKQVRKDTKKRQCRLQIAYSTKVENSIVKIFDKCQKTTDLPQKSADLSTKSSHFVERSANFVEKMDQDEEDERNEFLQCLQLQMNGHAGNSNSLTTPTYFKDKLKFNKLQKLEVPSDFVFNYKIHVIIYGSNTKCRLNLSQEFEGKEYLEEDSQ